MDMNRRQQKPVRLAAHLCLEPLENRLLLTHNLIYNGDFELGNVGFGSDYTYSPSNYFEGRYHVVSNPKLWHPQAASYGDHTTGAGLMMAVNGALVPNKVVWAQTVNVAPNNRYVFSLWVSNWDPFPSDAVAKLEFRFDGLLVGAIDAPTQAGTWVKFVTKWHSRASNQVTITIVDKDLTLSGNDFALDDISLVRNKPGPPSPDREASRGWPPLPTGDRPPLDALSAVPVDFRGLFHRDSCDVDRRVLDKQSRPRDEYLFGTPDQMGVANRHLTFQRLEPLSAPEPTDEVGVDSFDLTW